MPLPLSPPSPARLPAQELELSYVRRLRALLGAFNPPALLTGPGLLSPAEAATIFRCVARSAEGAPGCDAAAVFPSRRRLTTSDSFP